MIFTSTGTNWVPFRTLEEQAITAVKEVSPTTAVMIHYAGLAGASYYFSNLLPMTPDIDMIALSYYPQYHGKNIDSVRIVVNSLVAQFHKPVVIAETSYPWTLGWNDYTNNFIWTQSQTIPAYTPTDSGQAHFIGKMLSIMHGEANDSNFGICYWAPDWVAFKGPTSTDGSAWENQTLFDFQNKAVTALDTLGKK
jgi:arabinogalactan endo-1,4-beta-galactosidase